MQAVVCEGKGTGMDGYTLSISRCSGGDGVEESFKAKIKRREAALDAFAVAEAYCKGIAPLSGTKERDGAYTANKRNKNAENEARRKSECRHLRSLRSVRRVDVHQGCGENPGDAAEESEEEETCLLPACKLTLHRHQHLVFP